MWIHEREADRIGFQGELGDIFSLQLFWIDSNALLLTKSRDSERAKEIDRSDRKGDSVLIEREDRTDLILRYILLSKMKFLRTTPVEKRRYRQMILEIMIHRAFHDCILPAVRGEILT
jgi:hypothetical protein